MAENPRFGSSFDDWLKKQGLYEDATEHAIERVREWQKQRLRYLLRNFKAEHRHDEVDLGPPKGKEVW